MTISFEISHFNPNCAHCVWYIKTVTHFGIQNDLLVCQLILFGKIAFSLEIAMSEGNICKGHKHIYGVNVMEITAVMERARTLTAYITSKNTLHVEKNVPVATRPINQSFKRTSIGYTTLQ